MVIGYILGYIEPSSSKGMMEKKMESTSLKGVRETSI